MVHVQPRTSLSVVELRPNTILPVDERRAPTETHDLHSSRMAR